jgi:hypothetical protein
MGQYLHVAGCFYGREFHHMSREAVSRCGNLLTVVAQYTGYQSEGQNLTQSPVSWILPDIQSDLQKTPRWLKIPSVHDFVLEHLGSLENPADGPCRQLYNEIGCEMHVA